MKTVDFSGGGVAYIHIERETEKKKENIHIQKALDGSLAKALGIALQRPLTNASIFPFNFLGKTTLLIPF